MLSGINLVKSFKGKFLSSNETIYTADNNNYIVMCYVVGVSSIVNNTQSIVAIYNTSNALISTSLAYYQSGQSIPFTNLMIGQLQENSSLKFVKGGANLTVDIYIFKMNDEI
jgi:hypothetical protein